MLRRASRLPDHPRVGGEHRCSTDSWIADSGSSPRGRGTQVRRSGICQVTWIIPAWAGNTEHGWRLWLKASDHPRVGGEHCGRHFPAPFAIGSSPRGRGTLWVVSGGHHERRIIPAWAGNTVSLTSRSRNRSDHPRVGGEHAIRSEKCSSPVQLPDHPRVGGEHEKMKLTVSASDGSSPRGRGTR